MTTAWHLFLPVALVLGLLAAPPLRAQAPPAPEPRQALGLAPEVLARWQSEANRAGVLDALNAERQRLGLAPLRVNAQLQRAAQTHADYLQRHGLAGHLQDAQKEGFSGQRVLQRARAQGYAARGNEVAELFVIGLTDVGAALQQLRSGPYHRHFLHWVPAAEIGIGLNAQPGLVLVIGAPPALTQAGPEWLLWPPPDARDVAGAACCERPRPAGLDDFGMPVSVQGPVGRKLQVQRFELRDAQGALVPTRLLESGSDVVLTHAPHVAYLLPLKALAAGQRYRVSLQAESAGLKLTREWTFHTARQP